MALVIGHSHKRPNSEARALNAPEPESERDPGASLHALELLHHVVHAARLGLHVHGLGVRLVLGIGVVRQSLDDLVEDRKIAGGVLSSSTAYTP